MATRKTRSEAASSLTAKDMDTPVSLYPIPFEEAVKALLSAPPVDRPTKREKSA